MDTDAEWRWSCEDTKTQAIPCNNWGREWSNGSKMKECLDHQKPEEAGSFSALQILEGHGLGNILILISNLYSSEFWGNQFLLSHLVFCGTLLQQPWVTNTHSSKAWGCLVPPFPTPWFIFSICRPWPIFQKMCVLISYWFIRTILICYTTILVYMMQILF